jgi:hypothetical protein
MLDPLLEAVAVHWDEVHAGLTPEQSATITDAAVEFDRTASPTGRLRIRLRLVRLLTGSLPDGHPVRRHILAQDRAVRPAIEVDWDASAELIIGAAVDREIRLAKLDLLAEPGYSPAEVRALGGDPDQAGLLRLPVPGGGHRLPSFQFTAAGHVHPVVVTINGILRADTDPWGVADWWLRGNSWLDAIPADRLGAISDEELVLTAEAVRGDE